MNAKVKKLIEDRGFGFLASEDGTEYFFHMSAIDPKSGIRFENLKIDQEVSFIPMVGDKGPKASPRSLIPVGLNTNGE